MTDDFIGMTQQTIKHPW